VLGASLTSCVSHRRRLGFTCDRLRPLPIESVPRERVWFYRAYRQRLGFDLAAPTLAGSRGSFSTLPASPIAGFCVLPVLRPKVRPLPKKASFFRRLSLRYRQNPAYRWTPTLIMYLCKMNLVFHSSNIPSLPSLSRRGRGWFTLIGYGQVHNMYLLRKLPKS
jgi:hypothetical protein